MDLIVIRTKLESIIANELLDKNIISKKYLLIELYQHSINEDDDSVYRYYSKLSKKAVTTLKVIESNGMIQGFTKYLIALLAVKFTRGNLFYAGITNYPIALSIKFLLFKKIFTFDNGNVNIDSTMKGTYHKNNILQGNSIKRKIARTIFPKGCNNFIATKIIFHFSIFHNYKNITDINKTIPISINWKKYLAAEDRLLAKKNIKKIMLGTVFSERSEKQLDSRKKYLKDVDLYIAHPREDIDFLSEKIINPISPPESLIEKWKDINFLKIYHFNSTVNRLWENNKNIEFINIEKENELPLPQLDSPIQMPRKIEFKDSQKFLVCSPYVNKTLLEKDFLEIERSKGLKFRLIPKFIIIFIYGYLKLAYLYFIQKNSVSLKDIDHIVLESDSKHMYQNYFKFFAQNKNKKYLLIKAYKKESFTSIQKIPFALMHRNFIDAIVQLIEFSKISSAKLFKIAYKNVFKSISIYAYWNSFFSTIKKDNDSLKLFSSSCQIADCAATNVNFQSTYIAHGLVDKFYTTPSFNEVWVYSEDERLAYAEVLEEKNVQTYDFQKIDAHSQKILVVMSALDEEMNIKELISVCESMVERKYSIVVKMHASNKNSKIFSMLQKSIDTKIELNDDASVADALQNVRPYLCIGWTSTGLCESLNMNIIPVSLSNKNSEYVDQMVYRIENRSFFWPEDKTLILDVALNKNKYETTIDSLRV